MATQIIKRGHDLRNRINKLAWNGNFYTHWIPDTTDPMPDFGVDTSQQVTMSNAWALGTGISADKKEAILKTYERIDREKPKGAAGAFYACYPPFENGWKHAPKWHYMNGGLTPICAGELAHGAFNNGHEAFGVKLLRDVAALRTEKGIIPGGTRGAPEQTPSRRFRPVDLSDVVNITMDTAVDRRDDKDRNKDRVPGWMGRPGNGMPGFPSGTQTFESVPFELPEAYSLQGKQAIGLSGRSGYPTQVSVPVTGTFKTAYLLHAIASSPTAGALVIQYMDGTHATLEITKQNAAGPWWIRRSPCLSCTSPHTRVAWIGANEQCPRIGAYIHAATNPHPEKEVTALVFDHLGHDGFWGIMGITLSPDAPWLPSGPSDTFPKEWGAASCIYGLMEGLAGIENTGLAFDRARVAPRWVAADVEEVEVTARYVAGRGYATYRYRNTGRLMELVATGSAAHTRIEILLPQGSHVDAVHLNEAAITPIYKTVAGSSYVALDAPGPGPHRVRVALKSSPTGAVERGQGTAI